MKRSEQPELQDYLLEMFDHFGVHIEDLAAAHLAIKSARRHHRFFPSMPAEGVVATCDRGRALGP